MKRFLFGGFIALLCSASAFADFSFQQLDYPGAKTTTAWGVSKGIVVGSYTDTTSSYPTHGFIYNGLTYSRVDYPGSTSTRILDVDNGRMVGTYDLGGLRHGFVYDGVSFATIDDPLTSKNYFNGSEAWGISGNKIAGYFMDDSATTHGYVYDGNSFTTIDNPYSPVTFVAGIDGNKVIGNFTSSNIEHSFVYDGTSYTLIDDPLGTRTTEALGISGNQVVGWYSTVAQPNLQRGFIFDGTHFNDFQVPQSSMTVPVGIDNGVIVGDVFNATGEHGFIATIVPEPTSAALFAFAAMMFGMQRSRKRSI